MKDYLKSIALMVCLFALLAGGTVATSQSGIAIEIARSSAKSFCLNAASGRFAAACRSFARRV